MVKIGKEVGLSSRTVWRYLRNVTTPSTLIRSHLHQEVRHVSR